MSAHVGSNQLSEGATENPFFEKGEEDLQVPSATRVDEDPDEKTSLNKHFEKKYTYLMVFGIVANIVMLLYSHLGLSAVIKSSICPEGFDGCPEEIDFDDSARDLCVNEHDSPILVPGNPALDCFQSYMSDFGFACAGGDQCLQNKLIENFDLSVNCTTCLVFQANCAVDNCFKECFRDSSSEPCLLCAEQFCTEAFETCTGVDFPSGLEPPQNVTTPADCSEFERRLLQEDEEVLNTDCFDKDEYELFKVFNLTFVNSIEEALKGGSQALAILIIFASGIWPYLKNILMVYSWFGEMTQSRRDVILRILAILGKWSLVDVFAVVLIINGVLIQKDLDGDVPLIVFAESRPGIYMFGIAALWALAQGEAIRFFEKERLKQNIPEDHGDKKDTKISPENEMVLKKIRLLLGISSVLSFMFGMIGLIAINLSFAMNGRITLFDGPNSSEFSVFDLGGGLVSECAIYDGHESVPGAYFLTSVFLVMCAIIPIMTTLLLAAVAAVYHHSHVDGYFVGFTFGLGNFASMDVFLLSLLTLASQFEGLIDAAVGDGVDEQCGVTPDAAAEGEFCINFKGKINGGAWLLAVSILFFWIAQYAAGMLMAHTFKFIGPYAE